MAYLLQQGSLPSSRLCPGPPSTSFTAPASLSVNARSSRIRLGKRSDGFTIQTLATATADAPIKRAARVPPLPFVKVAGQEEMKLALLLNVVDSGIGGVLIMGDRGTGKSIAVRAVVELLPDIDVVEDDPFNSSPTDTKLMGPQALQRHLRGEKLPSTKAKTPLVELPLGATEDRICGTIDVEKALQQGVKAFEPGLLARAHRGILYVDEVNLLDDGLVDVVLDSAASGVNTVEREGISIQHPAKFIMIGSGNPQEGEMRPQLLDRFGMCVNVTTMMDSAARTQMVLDKIAYEQDPDKFCESAEAEQVELREKLQQARDNLRGVETPMNVKLHISEICSLLDVDGIRGDIVTNRAARALVAFEGRSVVTMEDVKRVIGVCVNHRLRKDPLEQIDSGTKVMLAFQRITNPDKAKAAEKAKKEAEEKQKKDTKRGGGMKAGAWSGLP